MDFQNYASKETAALISELLATQSGGALRQLQAMRDALDAAARALATPAHLEHDVHELVARLTGAADDEARRIREEASAALETVRGELQAQQAAHDKVAAASALAEAEGAILRSELQTAHNRAESAERDLTITIEAHAEVEANLRKVESDWKHAQQARAAIEAELSRAHSSIGQLLAEVEQLRGDVERQAAENTALTGELTRAREVFQQRDALIAQLEASHARVHALDADVSHARSTRDTLAAELEAESGRLQALERELTQAREIREHRDRIVGQLAASNGRVQTLERELTQAKEIRNHRDTIAAQLDASSARIETLERELSHAKEIRQHRDTIAAQLDASGVRIQALERELSTANEIRKHRDTVAAQLDATNARIQTLESELAQTSELREQRDILAADAQASSARVRELEKEIAAARDARKQRDALASQLDAASSRVLTLEKELASARELIASGAGDTLPVSAKSTHAEPQIESLQAEVDRMASLFDASARAVTEMAGATDSTALLTELVKRLSIQFSRVALFRVKGNRLEGEQQIGLEGTAGVSKLTIPTSVDSMLTRAISSGAVQSLYGQDVATRAGVPFGGSPTSAVALPIVLQGTPLAVVYADDADMPDSARGPTVHESSLGFARLLVGQVVVLLVRHTHELKTLAELSNYAATLLQEAKEMHLADTQAGKKAELVRSRLKDNIECASQLYAYRAAMEGTAAAALLDEQILAELQESTAFAHDLATVVGKMGQGDLQITAEAS